MFIYLGFASSSYTVSNVKGICGLDNLWNKAVEDLLKVLSGNTYRDSFPGIKQPKRDVDHSPPCNPKSDTGATALHLLLLRTFMACMG